MVDTLRRKNRHDMCIDNVYEANQIATSLERTTFVEYTVEENLRNQVLHETIFELKEEYRSLLIMYYMEEKPCKEIAAELGVSEQVIAQRLVRARRKLLGLFVRRWNDGDD